MNNTNNSEIKKTIFDLNPKLISTLEIIGLESYDTSATTNESTTEVKDSKEFQNQQPPQSTPQQPQQQKLEDDIEEKLFTCNTCELLFQKKEEQAVHFKSDFHRFNLKLKSGGVRKAINENEFQKLLDDGFHSSDEDEFEDDQKDDDDIEEIFQKELEKEKEMQLDKEKK